MKTLTCQIVIALALTCAHAQNTTTPNPAWNATINVVDETGQPIPDADVEISYSVPPPPDRTEAAEISRGRTDTNGVFRASHQDTGSLGLGFRVTKAGYYPTTRGYELYVPGQFDDKTVAANRNPNLTLVLKRIGHPIPMYAKRLNLGIPAFDKQLAFDLMTGDWAAPYGKGTSRDVSFTAHLDQREERDADYKLVVSFPNPGDGIQEYHVPPLLAGGGSQLLSPREAPLDGYQARWVQTRTRRLGHPEQGNRDPKRLYFLRVQTVRDERGNVKSALYGKIYGDFMEFAYYLNPTPNSRNVEFDPKQNLLKGLKSTEPVDAP